MKTSLLLVALALAPLAAQAVEYTAVVPRQSAVQFEFRQMGVPVRGHFKRFDVQLRFDPARPALAQARIEIDLASIDAGSSEADDASRDPLWFDTRRFPKAVFTSREVRALGNNRYELRGSLNLKGRSRDLVIPVSYRPAGNAAASFDGGFDLKRLDFGVGEGMWADVATVANGVHVQFRITATGK